MRGVYYKNMKWQAAIKVDKKQIHLGTVGSQEEAARLYDRYLNHVWISKFPICKVENFMPVSYWANLGQVLFQTSLDNFVILFGFNHIKYLFYLRLKKMDIKWLLAVFSIRV